MIILGLDPGYAITGYGVINFHKGQMQVLDYGVISTKAGTAFEKRLLSIYDKIKELIEIYKVDIMAVEEIFFVKNMTTAIGTSHARGVCILAAAQKKIPIFEYTPLQIKMALTSYGKANKKQIQYMVKLLLNLNELPKPDDAADALAVAICQANTGIKKENLIVAGYQKGAA